MTDENIRQRDSLPMDSLQVMACIIKKCRELGKTYNVTKLQKLMYCCDGVTLATYGIPLSKERPEAWQYGPVYPKVLQYIQKNGIESVLASADDSPLPEDIEKLITGTILFFGDFSASQLSAWSHKIGSPWYRASNGGTDLRSTIDDLSIKSYFKSEVLA